MFNRKKFAETISNLNLSHLDRAIAFLWYYRNSQEFDERSAGELACDLHDEDFPKPNVTILKKQLVKSRYTTRGKRKGTFQLDVRKIKELDDKYNLLMKIKKHTPSEIVLPTSNITGTRNYLEKIVDQINNCYDLGFYDSCAVMMRRLMESLIIEIYIAEKRSDEIKNNGLFFHLEALITHITNDHLINLSRGNHSTIEKIKELGDTAAHDRVYITQQPDIDDLKFKYRKLIQELLILSKIKK